MMQSRSLYKLTCKHQTLIDSTYINFYHVHVMFLFEMSMFSLWVAFQEMLINKVNSNRLLGTLYMQDNYLLNDRLMTGKLCNNCDQSVFQVGTVLNTQDARIAMKVGAKFLMSPAMIKVFLGKPQCFFSSQKTFHEATMVCSFLFL